MFRLNPLYVCTLFLTTVIGLRAQDQIQLESVGNNQVKLSWPQSGSGYLLEKAGLPSSLDVWMDAQDGVTSEGGMNSVVVEASEIAQFFRLRLDIPDTIIALGEGSGEVPLGLPAPPNPTGADLVITITDIPTNGTIKKKDGTVVTADTILTLVELMELTFTLAEVEQAQAKGDESYVPRIGDPGSSELVYSVDYGGGVVVFIQVALKFVAPDAGPLIVANTPQTGTVFFKVVENQLEPMALPDPQLDFNGVGPVVGFINGQVLFTEGSGLWGFDGMNYTRLIEGISSPGIFSGEYYYYRNNDRELSWTNFSDGGNSQVLWENEERNGTSNPSAFTEIEGVVYFMANNGTDNTWYTMESGAPVKVNLIGDESELDTAKDIYFYQGDFPWGPGAFDRGWNLFGFDGSRVRNPVDINPGANPQVGGITPYLDGILFRGAGAGGESNFYLHYVGEARELTLTPFDGPGFQPPPSSAFLNDIFFYTDGSGSPLWKFAGAEGTPVFNQPFSGVQGLTPIKAFEDFIALWGSDNTRWVFDGVDFTQPTLPGELSEVSYYDALDPDLFSNDNHYISWGLPHSSLVNYVWDGAESLVPLADPYGNTGGSLINPRFTTPQGGMIFDAAKRRSTPPQDPLEPYLFDGLKVTKLDGKSVDLLVNVNPNSHIEFQGTLYFESAVAGENKLLVFDGVDVYPPNSQDPGPDIVSSAFFIPFGEKLLFWGSGGVNLTGTWSFNPTDGSYEFEMGFLVSNAPEKHLVLDSGGLVFAYRESSAAGEEFWYWDGVQDPTPHDLFTDPNFGSRPAHFSQLGDLVYFSAADNENANEGNLFQFWKFDPAKPKESPIKIPFPGIAVPQPSHLTEWNGLLYLTAETASNERQLFSYDENADPQFVQISTAPNLEIRQMLLVDDTLYFTATNPTNGHELWSYDGLNPPSIAFESLPLAEGLTTGASLYERDGTVLIYSSNIGIISFDGTTPTDPVEVTGQVKYLGGNFYFTGAGFFGGNNSHSGQELWFTNGISDPQLVEDFNSDPVGPWMAFAMPNPFGQENLGLRLTGNVTNDVLVSSSGDDTITGKAGADRFVFAPNWGMDVITDFEDGLDLIDLVQAGTTFGELNIYQVDLDTVIDAGSGNTITLKNTDENSVSMADFILAEG